MGTFDNRLFKVLYPDEGIELDAIQKRDVDWLVHRHDNMAVVAVLK